VKPSGAPVVTAADLARERLAADSRTAALAAAPFVAVPGGLSNHGWRVRAGALDCFVRLARPGAESLGADRHAECRLLQLVAHAGIAPPVVRCDPAARLLVTRWIDEEQADAMSRGSAVRLRAVAAQLVCLHALRAAEGSRRVDFAARAAALESLLAPVVRAGSLAEVARGVFARLAADARTDVLCHHDLHALNLLFDRAGRLWVVDWEYAGLGDPVYDLASFASQHRLGRRAEDRLVAAYRDVGGQVDPARVPLARWAFDYVQWLWYRAACAATAPGAGAGDELARRARRLGRSLRQRASGVPGLR
jgi:thiamine kinase-like enzyme